MSDPAERSAAGGALADRWPAAVALLALAMGLASFGYPRTTLDSPASTYIGALILEGDFPYRDGWDLRAPGVYFAYALNIALLGKSALAMRVFDLLWQSATALLILLIARRWVGRSSAAVLAAGFYVAGYYSQHYSTWVQPDGYLNLPLALSCWLGLRALDRDRIAEWAAAAFAVGIAALFKLPFGLFGVGLLGAAIALPAGAGRRLARIGALAGGLTVAFLGCSAYFWSGGALQDLLDAQFRFAPAYVARIHSVVTFGNVLAQFSRPVLIPFFMLFAMAALAVPWAIRQRGRETGRVALVLTWLATGLFTILVQGSYLLYHLIPLLPPLALLAAPRAADAFRTSGTGAGRSRALVRVALALFLATSGTKLFLDARFTLGEARGRSADIWRGPGLELRDRTTPDETIFVWGNVPALYIHADRRAACRFLPTAFLSMDVPGLDYHAVCLGELARNRPSYIVLVPRGPVTPGLEDALTSLEGFPGLVNLIASEYELDEHNELFDLYRAKPGRLGSRSTGAGGSCRECRPS